MARAHVYAAAHPKSPDVLLVRVLDDAGADLLVGKNYLTVMLWAYASQAQTVQSPVIVPITHVDAAGVGFWDVRLGSVQVDTPTSATDLGVAELKPTVYAIDYNLPIMRNQPTAHHGAVIVRVG